MINAKDIRVSIECCYAVNGGPCGLTTEDRDAEVAYLDELIKDAKRFRVLRLASYDDAVTAIIDPILKSQAPEPESPEEMNAYLDVAVCAVEAAGYSL